MGRKGQKSSRGQPETDWGEPKTERLNLKLTKTGKDGLDLMAEENGTTITDLLERIGRDGCGEKSGLLKLTIERMQQEFIDEGELGWIAHDTGVDIKLLTRIRDCLATGRKKNGLPKT
jgi:hypothetical protein